MEAAISNTRPTTYQRRYLIYCEAVGATPGETKNHEFSAWVMKHYAEFREERGIARYARLTQEDQAAFDEFLRSKI